MTREEAIRILDPETTIEALVEIEYYAGFSGPTAKVQAVDAACVIAVSDMRAMQELVTNRSQLNYLESDTINRTESDTVKGVEIDQFNADQHVSNTGNALKDWISVEDRLPPGMADVLVVAFWHERWQTMIGWCRKAEEEWRVYTSHGEVRPGGVTHWMPLPEPPKEI